INHLEGHIHAVLLEARQNGGERLEHGAPIKPVFSSVENRAPIKAGAPDEPAFGSLGWKAGVPDEPAFGSVGSKAASGPLERLEFPVLALVVSGGHTHLYLAEQVDSAWRYQNVGHTRDDAAGEAFDKVAKLLALGYPGGPIIDALAKYGDATAVNFPAAQLKHRDRKDRGPAPERPHFDFSFSGIKTAVLRYVETQEMAPSIASRRSALAQLSKPGVDDIRKRCDRKTLDLVASFQRGVVQDLAGKTLAAAREYQTATLLVSGGVAANSELRQVFQRMAAREGLRVLFPSRPLSTDNAAMIAAAAYPKWQARNFASDDLTIEASLPLR
ncbi:MAG: hypothetical protein ABSD96_12765, partial [Candidatus Korobacteraceae bacterium]